MIPVAFFPPSEIEDVAGAYYGVNLRSTQRMNIRSEEAI